MTNLYTHEGESDDHTKYEIPRRHAGGAVRLLHHDDLYNWGHGRHCIFWRQGHSYIIVMDAEIGFGRERHPLTLMAARHDAATGVIWSMPREIEMRAEDGWVVLLERERKLLRTEQIEKLRKLFMVDGKQVES